MNKGLYAILFLVISFAGCENSPNNASIEFELNNSVFRSYDQLKVTSVENGYSHYQWSIEGEILDDFSGSNLPVVELTKWNPGTYRINLIAQDSSGKMRSGTITFRVGTYRIKEIRIFEIREKGKLWDTDSTGLSALPDIFFQYKKNDKLIFESPTYWNVDQEKLPLSLELPEDIFQQTKYIETSEFFFMERDQENNTDLSMNYGLDVFDDDYNPSTKKGTTKVYTSGYIDYEVSYELE